MKTLNIFKSRTFVPPSGVAASAKYIIVGEQPGVTEVRTGQPFKGPSGDVLSSCLSAANISRGLCYITNVIKDLDKSLAAYYNPESGQFSPRGQEYISLLQEELARCNPNATIIAVGAVALTALTGRVGITKWRGSILEPALSVPQKFVVGTFHPATVLPPKNVFTNRYLIINDIKKVHRVATTPNYELPHYDIKIEPTYSESLAFLGACENQGTIAFDIEVYNLEVSCISFAFADRAISIPFIGPTGDWYSPEQETEIWLRIARLLENPKITKVGQNLVFDIHFLLTKYGIKTTNIEDTMIAQQIISFDFPKGLDFICAAYTDIPYYKADGKIWLNKGGKWQNGWTYNALDSVVCIVAFPQQLAMLTRQGNLSTYRRQLAVSFPLIAMMYNGIKVNLEGLTAEGESFERAADLLDVELVKEAGYMLNANSSKQLIEFFYEKRKHKAYKNRATGRPSVDNIALKRLKRKGERAADLILQSRKLRKVSSTYLQPHKIDPDSRIRCSYNPVGTKFSRVSSSSNIFGTGMNMQNWPHKVQRFLEIDDDYIGFAIDLGQAENRIVAQLSNCQMMINAFETGVDVHSLTATGIFPELSWQEIKAEDNKKVLCPLGDGTHTKRFWGKKSNHSLNYDIGYKTFSLNCEIPEREGKQIIAGYHALYPEIRNNFHKKVQDEIRSKRCLTNLLGRKTFFLESINDKTFKNGYSCIPQGTVGDIINERGLNYMYYNPDLFGPIQLLSQIHDEIVFQIPTPFHKTDPCSWENIARMLTLIKISLETPLTYEDRTFVIPADITTITRFKCGIDIDFSGDILQRAEIISNTYEKLRCAN